MNVAKTLSNANAFFKTANARISASDLQDAYAAEREFRERVCKFAKCNDEQRPHVRNVLAFNVWQVLHLANSEADAKAVTDLLMA